MSDKVISSTTQEFLDVYDIVNDMVLLKDGTAAVILQVGTMNFSLLAEQEQDAVIFTYGSLLNSLNYPIQINIQSQTKDATKYLRLLDEQITKASSDRKATLIKKYRDFVAALIKERNVLQKRFYIIVPASPGEMGLITPSSVLPGKTTFDISMVEKSVLLEKAMNILEPRKDHLTSQFNRLGLYVRQLSTQEVIQNFYINYNPEAAEGQEISSSENYTTPLVRASFGGKFMQPTNQPNNIAANPAMSSTQDLLSPTPEEIISGNPPAAPVNVTPTPTAVTAPISPAASAVAPLTSTPVESPVATPATTQITAPIIESVEPPSNIIAPENIPEPTPIEPVAEQITEPTVAAITPTASELITPIESPAIVEPAPVAANQPVPTIGNVFGADQQVATNQSNELDLNLDAKLISSNFSEPKPEDFTQNFIEENIPEKNQAEQTETTVEQKQETTPAAAPELTTTEPPSNFAEEITPIQNKFESQVKSTE